MSDATPARPKITVGLLFAWTAGGLLGLAALGSVTQGHPLAALPTALAAALALPPVRRGLSVDLSGGIVAVLVIGLLVVSGWLTGPQPRPPTPRPTGETATPATPPLRLDGFQWAGSYGFFEASGRVTNVSGERIENLQAVVTFSDAAGGYVTHDTALVEYTALLPGQTTPFRVTTPANPAAERAAVEFNTLFGALVPHAGSGRP